MASLVLSAILRAQIAREAKAAFPRECCGLIEGYRGDARAAATALHPMRNIAQQCDRFEIDPAQHIALLRKLRGTARAIIGCYHSHPNGRAEPSAHDGGYDNDFVWVVAVASPQGALAVTAHLRKDDKWHALAIETAASRR